ncbi:MAG: 3-oxoacyl-ACP synthase, partial [Bacteroidota bacterium]
MSVKHILLQHVQQIVQQRITNAQQAMQSAETAKNSQTKSSAGDKFETGRAMMQAEEERSKVQLAKAIALQNSLNQIDFSCASQEVKVGSLVTTNRGSYLLSVGLGKILVEGQPYFAISLASPIGQLLFGKEVGEAIIFR